MTDNNIIEKLLRGAGSEDDSSGNTGLPFGLCEKYGIQTGKDWTPRDAWDALDEKLGMKPEDFYDRLKEEENIDNDVELSHSQLSALQKVEDSIRGRKTEKGYIIGESGEMISVTVKSAYNKAKFQNVNMDAIQNAILTHNHPDNGTDYLNPLSYTDITWLRAVKGVRVVNAHGEMSIVKTSNVNEHEMLIMMNKMYRLQENYRAESVRINNMYKVSKDYADVDKYINAWGENKKKYFESVISLFETSAKRCGYVFRYKGSISPKIL